MSNLNPGHIFNVSEPTGKELVELETTAAEAQIEAPTSEIAREVEENADHVQEVARDAADAAKSKGPALTGIQPTAIDQFQQQAKEKTDTAVAEGHHDVNVAKAVGADYVEQVKALAASAISTAQSYLPESVGGQASTGGRGTSNTKVAASSAPLESGPFTVGNPYPSTTTGQGTKVAENAR